MDIPIWAYCHSVDVIIEKLISKEQFAAFVERAYQDLDGRLDGLDKAFQF